MFAQLQEASAQDINRYFLYLWKKLECKLALQSKSIQRRCKFVLKAVECKLVKHSNETQNSCRSLSKTFHKIPETTAIFVVAEETVEVVTPLAIYSHSGSWETLSPSPDVPIDDWLPWWHCQVNDFEPSLGTHSTYATKLKTKQTSSPWCFGSLREDESFEVKSFGYKTSSENSTDCFSSTDTSYSNSIADEKTQASNFFACSYPCHFLSSKKKHTMFPNEIVLSRDHFSDTSSLSLSSNSSFEWPANSTS